MRGFRRNGELVEVAIPVDRITSYPVKYISYLHLSTTTDGVREEPTGRVTETPEIIYLY